MDAGKVLEIIAEKGIETELMLLRKLTIKGCDGCLACEAGGKGQVSAI